MEYAVRHPERLTHLVLMNTAPATSDDAHALGDHLQSLPGRDVAAMRALAESPAYRAGDLGVEAAYYRLHFSTTVARAELLERLLPRLRAHYTPEGVVLARAIEDR